ncbi:MAG: helix-turn-helix transcriptional regulator [Bacteroidetes bacterium]|nr:helix-turn-helix transcriptional regulator [Bacteroidota bacterium]
MKNNKLKEIRISKNLTQNEVAKLLGFHTNERISKWENGMKMPSVVNLFLLAKLYQVSPLDLYPEILQCPPIIKKDTLTPTP